MPRKLTEIAPAWGRDTDAMVARFFPQPEIARRVRDDLAAIGLPVRKSSTAAN